MKWFTTDQSLDIAKPINPWNRVGEIARRVGVEPSSSSDGVIIKTDDGNYYNLFDVVTGVLDYMDSALQK